MWVCQVRVTILSVTSIGNLNEDDKSLNSEGNGRSFWFIVSLLLC